MAANAPKTLQHRQTAAFRQISRRLAKRVRQLRAQRGWTQERAAEKMGVEPAHVRRIEAGTANPSPALLVSIAKALGISVTALLSEEEKR